MGDDKKLTNLQREILKVFKHDLSEAQLLEVKRLLSAYFADKATMEMDKLWESKNWNEDTIRQWSKSHTRTPYKQ
jgi:hypothetical protein